MKRKNPISLSAMCCVEWLGRLKYCATALDVSLPLISLSQFFFLQWLILPNIILIFHI